MAWSTVVLMVSGLCQSCLGQAEPTVVLHGEHGPVQVRVEVALTREAQARGLMWRDQLDQDAGMLFVFPQEQLRVFWMKNTPLPLDIIYVGDQGRVVSVAEQTTPYSTAPIPSGAPARYVLEVNAGFAKKHSIAAGTRVELPDEYTSEARDGAP